MSNPELFAQLLDAAIQKTGSEYQLAKEIGVNRSQISNWKSGYSKCSPEDAALIAGIAGLNPEEWMARMAVAKHEGTAKGEKLKSVLKKALLATGGAIATSTASAATLSAKLYALYTMYIM